MNKTDPWYIHVALYLVVAILTYFLIQLAIIQPNKVVTAERFFKKESRLRMNDIRQAEILWQVQHNRFTDNLDSLVHFIKTDSMVHKIMTSIDTLTKKPSNPFVKLSNGKFTPDSLFRTPKSHRFYILKVDTSRSIDTTINRRGKIIKIDTSYIIGTRYLLKDPDGYGKIGSLTSDALKNTASWE